MEFRPKIYRSPFSNEQAKNTYTIRDKDERPWGTWKVIAVYETAIEKKIVVNPGGVLSEQRHSGRAETWTILEGSGEVTLGREEDKNRTIIAVNPNSVITIPVNTWHRIRNTGSTPLVFHEKQEMAGEKPCLAEDDIQRGLDLYDRK